MDYKQAFFSKLEDCYLGVRVKNFTFAQIIIKIKLSLSLTTLKNDDDV